SNLMRRADRTRTCNLRFWRPLRYQLRHCPRVDRTKKLVCDLHQSPIIANAGQDDKSTCVIMNYGQLAASTNPVIKPIVQYDCPSDYLLCSRLSRVTRRKA